MSIYNIVGIVKKALPSAATPRNIEKGFAVSDIFPFDQTMFADKEFMPSSVTDRPLQNGITIDNSELTSSALTTGILISQFPSTVKRRFSEHY